MVGFARVKELLDKSIADWEADKKRKADLDGHGDTFSWATRDELLKAFGHSKKLIQDMGPGKGATSNLVLDLRKGIPLRMPKDGPFLTDAEIQEIQDWIDQNCPE